jgi:hypothetical protein
MVVRRSSTGYRPGLTGGGAANALTSTARPSPSSPQSPPSSPAADACTLQAIRRVSNCGGRWSAAFRLWLQQQ